MRVIAALALATAWSVALAQAAPQPATPPATIRVTGRAEVSEVPDRVYVDIGVTTQARTSQAASSNNADRLHAVITAVQRSVGPDAELTTTQYSIAPDYQYHPDGAAPTLVGYTATNVVRIRLDDLSKIGRVIDAATEAGANRVEDIRFTLRNAEAARTAALREAALDAREEARALAEALDLRIVRILSVSEQSPVIVPVRPIVMQRLSVAAPQASTPVESGTLNVDASVVLTVEVVRAAR